MGNRKKTGSFATLRIMQKYSDKDHILTVGTIMSYLTKQYGLSADRRTIYDNLAVLSEFGHKFEGFSSGHRGYSLINRHFTDDEIIQTFNALKSSKVADEEVMKVIKKMSSDYSIYMLDDLRKELGLNIL